MKRRRLLASLGGLAGASGVVGTSAFTSVSAQRAVDVRVANDADALLRLAPCKGSPNGDYVTGASSGTMTLDVSPSNGNVPGDGVNLDATTVFDNVFEICNQGTQPVGVWIEVNPIQNGNGDPAVEFYRNGDRSTEIVGPSNVACLDVGDCVCVGFVTRTHGLGSGTSLLDPVPGADGSELVVHADANVGCASTPGGGLTTVPGPTNGLLSYWPLDSIEDGTAEDVVGSNEGTPRNDVSSTGGQVDHAASFDGVDDYVEIPSIQVSGSLTVAAWVKRESNGGWQAASSQGNNSADTRNWWLGGRKNKDQVHWSIFDESTNERVDSSPGSLPQDTFTHIVGTYDASSGEQKIYIDGSLDTTESPGSFTPETSNDPGAIGAEIEQNGSAADLFDGTIDDVRVYDRALSDGEIQDLYDATK